MLDKSLPVLVVDDIQAARATIVNILKVLGFKQILEAANGEEAREIILAQGNKIQLVISDWKMPYMDGLELLRWIRREEKFKHLPFIFVTSKGEKEDIALASDEGIEGYLLKPVTIDAVIEKIEGLNNPNSPSVIVKKCLQEVEKLSKAKKLEEALNFLQDCSKDYPELLARFSYESAKICLKLKKLSDAKSYLREALKESSLMLKAWTALARVYLEERDYTLATEALKRALEISPNSTDNLFFMGKLYLLQEEVYKAKDYFTMALNSDPENEDLKQRIWNLYLELDLVEEVMRDFGPLLFESLTVDTLNNLAVSFRKKGKVQEAVKAYRQALKKEPENEKVHYNIAVAYLNLAQREKSLKHLHKAIEINPEFTQAQDLLSKILSATKEKKEDKEDKEEKENKSD